MVVCDVITSSFCLIFLLFSVLKSCGFSETSKEYKGSCSADIHKGHFGFCPKGRRNMDDMGNAVKHMSCGAKREESLEEAKEVDIKMLPRKSKEEVDKERRRSLLFGHEFREVDGEHVLYEINPERRFQFDVYDGDRAKNQQRYEKLGEAITEYVYEYLEKDLGLEKVDIPISAKDKDPKGFFFRSKDALEAKKLMILIHGSGVVRAGQWARSLIINVSFETGTMVPYIERAIQEGYGVLITNGNHNYDDKQHKRIKGCENPQEHFVYVWNKFIKGAKAKDIVIVAHSFGGVVVHHGVRNIKEATERIKAVAFTDSVHSVGYRESSNIKKWFKQRTRNWVSSNEELDTPVRSYYNDDSGVLVSAGTTEHVWTSHYAKESVFKFFEEKLAGEEESGKSNMNNKGDTKKVTHKGNAKAQENTKGAPSKNQKPGHRQKGKCGKKTECGSGDDGNDKNDQEVEQSELDEQQLEKRTEGELEEEHEQQDQKSEEEEEEEEEEVRHGSGPKDTEGGSEKDGAVRLTSGENVNTVLDDTIGGEQGGNTAEGQDMGGDDSGTGTPGGTAKQDEPGELKTEDDMRAEYNEEEKKKADNADECKGGDEDQDMGEDDPGTGTPGGTAKQDEPGELKTEDDMRAEYNEEQKKKADNADEHKGGDEDQDTGEDDPGTGTPGGKAKQDEPGELKTEDDMRAECDEEDKKKADNADECKGGDEGQDTGEDDPGTGTPGGKAKQDEPGELKTEDDMRAEYDKEQKKKADNADERKGGDEDQDMGEDDPGTGTPGGKAKQDEPGELKTEDDVRAEYNKEEKKKADNADEHKGEEEHMDTGGDDPSTLGEGVKQEDKEKQMKEQLDTEHVEEQPMEIT